MRTLFHQALIEFWASAGTAIIAALVGLAVRAFQKAGIDVSTAQLNAVVQTVEDAIHYTEESNAARVKAGQPVYTSADKLRLAVQFVIQQHPAQDAAFVQTLITAALSRLQMGAAAKTPPILR